MKTNLPIDWFLSYSFALASAATKYLSNSVSRSLSTLPSSASWLAFDKASLQLPLSMADLISINPATLLCRFCAVSSFGFCSSASSSDSRAFLSPRSQLLFLLPSCRFHMFPSCSQPETGPLCQSQPIFSSDTPPLPDVLSSTSKD